MRRGWAITAPGAPSSVPPATSSPRRNWANLFARCVVSALQPTLAALGDEADFLEIGGGSGAFAETALQALAAGGTLPRHYLILEPSADLRERQRERLQCEPAVRDQCTRALAGSSARAGLARRAVCQRGDRRVAGDPLRDA